MKKIQTPKVRTPQFLNNLYRDLRDRRLLLPAAALLIALIVVPLALSSSSATTAPPAVPATATGGSQQAAATSPAVLAEQLGVSDYRKRLERLQSKNPFKRQYTAVPKATESDTSSSVTSSASTTSSSLATGPSTSTSTTSDTTVTSSSPPASATPPEPTLYAFQADLAIGSLGDLTRRKSVKLGKFLPSEGQPMVAFAGATQDLKHGLFLVSDDVSSVTGDGRCIPGGGNCQLLRLKVGDEAKLIYAPEGGRTYKLKLLGIALAPIDAKATDKRGKRGSSSAFAAQG